MILIAMVAVRKMSAATPGKPVPLESRVGLSMLILAAVLSITVSLIAPRYALLAYLVNFLDTPLRRHLTKGKFHIAEFCPRLIERPPNSQTFKGFQP